MAQGTVQAVSWLEGVDVKLFPNVKASAGMSPSLDKLLH